jgi:nitroimidazol reductase NimA-like FMN-containing flavoprotein (pyridoxamine 5'-phosphate oxidase superfamily)
VEEAETIGERVRTVRVAQLATTDPDGRSHLVPIVFVFDGGSAA